MAVPSLPRDWIAAPFLRLLFQNLIVEERADIRDASLAAWRTALTILGRLPDGMQDILSQPVILEWYAIMMTPLGVPIDSSTFYHPSNQTGGDVAPERHNVDKNMLAQDLSLISVAVTMKARIAAATALAYIIVCWPANVSQLPPSIWF